MKIKKLIINNFRGIKQSEFELSDKFNVFVGVNGTGKTTILDAISISFSWLVNRIQREGSSGKPISETDIKNDELFSNIEISVEEGMNYSWRISKTARLNGNIEKSDLIGVSNLASYFQLVYREFDKLPVIAYYPVDRLVKNSLSEISGRETLNILDVYDNALGGKTNYQSFFEWFRLQDDILNEKSTSRSKWMINNKLWIRRRVNKLLEKFDNMVTQQGFEEPIYYKEKIKERFRRDELIYEEPRYLFRELIDILHFTHRTYKNSHEFEFILDELDYMLRKMSSLSENRNDNLVEYNDYPFVIISGILRKIEKLEVGIKENKEYSLDIDFIWEALLFSVLLSLWWVNDRGKREIESLFEIFNPLRQGKLSINRDRSNDEFIESLQELVKKDATKYSKASKSQGRELIYVTKAIESFIYGYSNLRVSRIPRPHMLVEKFGVTLSLDQLSDGEKNLIALVGDIARRLSIANANSKNPLEGEGIILIDEIDLHLHPAWQRLMVPKLGSIFPNCQFIFSTHSPQVLSHTKPESIFLLKQQDNKFTYTKALTAYGKDSNSILYDLMDTETGVDEVNKDLDELFKLIALLDLEKSETIYNRLVKILSTDDSKMVAARAELEYLKDNENDANSEN